MEGENAKSYTDMDIDEAIDDFSNRFINNIYYTTKQLGFEKVVEHQRNCAVAVLKEKDVFMAKPTGSEKISDLPDDFRGTRLHESSFFGR